MKNPLAMTAVEFCQSFQVKLRPEGLALLDADLSPQDYFHHLLENKNYADARRVLAHALPKRRALWWGCLCAWDAHRPNPPRIVTEVLQAVERFVFDPSEDNRRATEPLGKKAKPNTLAGCLAMAAFCSGGSMSRPDLPCVAPKPFVTGRLVGVTVYLASVIRDAAHYKDHLRQYLTMGMEIAQGRNLWPVKQEKEKGKRKKEKDTDKLLVPTLCVGTQISPLCGASMD